MKVCMESRLNGKTVKRLYDAFDYLIEKWPEGKTKITLYVVGTIYNSIKKLDGAHFRGRWLYVNYKDHEIFVKKVVIKEQEGLKTYQIKRIMNPELVKNLTKEHTHLVPGKEPDFKLNVKWEPVEWPNKEKKQ